MRRLLIVAVLASLIAARAFGASMLRVVEHVQPACDPEAKGPAVLLVHVVDHEGRTMEGIVVEASGVAGKRERRTLKTDAKGIARFKFGAKASLRVTAAFAGFFVSVAERVNVRNGCLAGLTLPMQIEVPKDHLTSGRGAESTAK